MAAGRDHVDGRPGLADLLDAGGVGQEGGVLDGDDLAGAKLDLVLDAGGGGEQAEVVLPLKALDDDLEVEQPEEAAAEAEPERGRRLGLVDERGVVEGEAFEGLAQLLVLVGVGRVDAGEDHGLGLAVAGEGSAAGASARVTVSPTRQSATSLRPGGDVADLAGGQAFEGLHARGEDAELKRLEGAYPSA